MSKQSYIDGFCKVAAANNVDPVSLAQYAFEKAAEGEGGDKGIWANVLEYLKAAPGKASDWYNGLSQNEKMLLGAGAGSLAGAGLGAAIKGKKGAGIGAGIGAGVGGLASGVDWKAIINALKSKKLSSDEIAMINNAMGDDKTGIESIPEYISEPEDKSRPGPWAFRAKEERKNPFGL